MKLSGFFFLESFLVTNIRTLIWVIVCMTLLFLLWWQQNCLVIAICTLKGMIWKGLPRMDYQYQDQAEWREKHICIHSFFPSCQGSLYLRTWRSFFQLNDHSICLQTGIFCVDQVLCYFAWRLLDLDSKDFNHTFLGFMSSMLYIVLDYNQY